MGIPSCLVNRGHAVLIDIERAHAHLCSAAEWPSDKVSHDDSRWAKRGGPDCGRWQGRGRVTPRRHVSGTSPRIGRQGTDPTGGPACDCRSCDRRSEPFVETARHVHAIGRNFQRGGCVMFHG
eukprot:scaffold122035_cov30-Tisochrysis_lutea.AAC.1